VPERDRVRVMACGELDLANAGHLESEIVTLLDNGFDEVVADLRDLAFIDSSGVTALLKCDRRAREAGRRVSVVLAPGAVARTIELCGVRDLLDVVS
jgi:anti-sigma B factor antagonist